MTFRIPAGKHRARPWRFGLWFDKNSFAWKVKFTESCRYDLQSQDQFDTNKLIGIGYLPGHHKESARFGWRYDTVAGLIALDAYCYVRGQRVIKHIAWCEIGKEYRLRLKVLDTSYYFDVYEPDAVKANGIVTVEHFHEKKLKYRLGVFFGGNKVAPHEIKIELEKL